MARIAPVVVTSLSTSRNGRRAPSLPTRLERWSTPDEDFVDVLRLDAGPERPRLFLLHGLEGTVRSHYVGGLLHMARERDWGADMLIFRGSPPKPAAVKMAKEVLANTSRPT